MIRPAIFDSDAIVTATIEVAATHGPAAASIARIAKVLGAPTGSIYHRFSSRGALLAEVWLRTAEDFQTGIGAVLQDDEVYPAGIKAACFTAHWTRKYPERARILLLHRREDFIDGDWPDALSTRAVALKQAMTSGLKAYTSRLTGNATERNIRIISYALAQAPLAAVKPYVQANKKPPKVVDDIIKVTFEASITLCQGE